MASGYDQPSMTRADLGRRRGFLYRSSLSSRQSGGRHVQVGSLSLSSSGF